MAKLRFLTCPSLFILLTVLTPGTASATPGNTSWTATYDGTAANIDEASDVAVDPTGTRVYVSGRSKGPGTRYDFATIAYDASSGSQLWVKRYDGPAHDSDGGGAIAVDPSGSTVYVTGGITGNRTGADAYTIAYDAVSGTKEWSVRYDGGGNESGGAIALLGGRLFVSINGASFATFLAYDRLTGDLLWKSSLRLDEYTQTASLDVSGKSVFFTGYVLNTAGYSDFLAASLKARTGALVWKKRYDGPSSFSDYASDGVVSPDGTTLYIAGTAANYSVSPIAVVAYDAATGHRMWLATIDALPGGDVSYPRLAVTPDGAAIMVAAGGADVDGPNTFLTAAIASTGSVSWTFLDDAAGHDGYPTDLVAGPDHVYVTGYGTHSGGVLGFITMAYASATGGPPDWTAEKASTFDSGSNAIAIAPDGGAVFVTGSQSDDYVTEAYTMT